MKIKMKKIAIFMGLILMLTGCNKSEKQEEQKIASSIVDSNLEIEEDVIEEEIQEEKTSTDVNEALSYLDELKSWGAFGDTQYLNFRLANNNEAIEIVYSLGESTSNAMYYVSNIDPSAKYTFEESVVGLSQDLKTLLIEDGFDVNIFALLLSADGDVLCSASEGTLLMSVFE